MTLAGIKPGDIVHCDVRGERFLAFVHAPNRGGLLVNTIMRDRPRIVTARQVVGHWRKRKARAEARAHQPLGV